MAGRRGNRERTLQPLNSLLHAGEPYTATTHSFVKIESHSTIAYSELDISGVAMEFGREMPRPAMLYRILQRFLQDTEQTKRNILRYGGGKTRMPEVDLYPMLFR